MSFSNTVLGKGTLPGGRVFEYGTWTSAEDATTGDITADTTGLPDLKKIVKFCASSNGDTEVMPALDAGDTILKLTFTANDSGTYYIEGLAY